MNLNFSQKMFIDSEIDKFAVNVNKSVKDAISLFGKNAGLPLVAINNNNEFIGTLSNGDIRIFLSNGENNIGDPIIKAINKKSKFCFEHYDKSIFDHMLSNTNIRIIPILDKHKKLKAVAYYNEIHFKIGKKILNNQSNYTYLIAEIGVNHNGRIEEAIELIDNISDAGFDKVKMQFRSSETYSKTKMDNDIDLSTEYILSELRRVELTDDQEKEIVNYIKRKT